MSEPAMQKESVTESVAVVRLRRHGPTDYFMTGGVQAKKGDLVVVGLERGVDYGLVLGFEDLKDPQLQEYQKIIRVCTPEDRNIIRINSEDARRLIPECQENVAALNLPMKVINAEFIFDKTKIVFYFAAPERVDFRQLVRDLAKRMRVRIELHQVGIRDEMRLLGGLGCCGREACCVAWVQEFAPVNIRMAKLQQIQLHPAKLSGCCGRLKCCLGFEQRNYRDLEQITPRKGQIVRTENGSGEVMDTSILAQTVTVKMEDGNVVVLPAAEVTVISRTKSRAKVRVQKRRRREEETLSDREYEQDLQREIEELNGEDE